MRIFLGWLTCLIFIGCQMPVGDVSSTDAYSEPVTAPVVPVVSEPELLDENQTDIEDSNISQDISETETEIRDILDIRESSIISCETALYEVEVSIPACDVSVFIIGWPEFLELYGQVNLGVLQGIWGCWHPEREALYSEGVLYHVNTPQELIDRNLAQSFVVGTVRGRVVGFREVSDGETCF